VARTVLAGDVTVQQQTSTYTPVRAVEVDPNYARPTSTSVTYSAASSVDGIVAPAGSRTVTTSRSMTIMVGSSSRPMRRARRRRSLRQRLRVDHRGDDQRGRWFAQRITHTLSADGTTIIEATTAYAKPDQPLTARSTTNYAYDAAG
jgi:hypothetical protein